MFATLSGNGNLISFTYNTNTSEASSWFTELWPSEDDLVLPKSITEAPWIRQHKRTRHPREYRGQAAVPLPDLFDASTHANDSVAPPPRSFANIPFLYNQRPPSAWQRGFDIDAASYGLTPQLSHQVNMLGQMVGQVLREKVDEEIFEHVYRIYIYCDQSESLDDPKLLQYAQKEVGDLSNKEIRIALRYLATLMNLFNQAAREEITRINRARELVATKDQPRSESIAAAVKILHDKGYTLEQAIQELSELDIVATITAHPTEARRRTTLKHLRNIGELLDTLHREDLRGAKRDETEEELLKHITAMTQTQTVRDDDVIVDDEVETGLFYATTTIWDTVPEVYRSIRQALRQYYGKEARDLDITLLRIFKYRSWIGGDRDGHDKVTLMVTRQTLEKHRTHAIECHLQALERLSHIPSLSKRFVNGRSGLAWQETLAPLLDKSVTGVAVPSERATHLRNEPFRLAIEMIEEKIRHSATLEEKIQDTDRFFYSSQDYINDLERLRQALVEAGFPEVAALKEIEDLLIQARTFGFTTYSLDIRQHSDAHESAVDNILRVANLAGNYKSLDNSERITLLSRILSDPQEIPDLNIHSLTPKTIQVLGVLEILGDTMILEPDAMGTYIVSMTHDPSDLLEVLVLAKVVGLWQYDGQKVMCPIKMVPLYETIEDLDSSGTLTDQLYSIPIYRAHLAAQGHEQEIMIGYSDGNKDGGKVTADDKLYEAQQRTARVSARHGIKQRIFHGNGDSAARGSAPPLLALRALPPEVQTGRINRTQQGEALFNYYSSPESTRRHLEQMLHAILDGKMHRDDPVPEMPKSFATASQAAFEKYRALIEDPDFWAWYITATPVSHIGTLPTASRPISRKAIDAKLAFDDLRAIPWVTAWVQTRFNVAGFYGAGTGLEVMLGDPTQRDAQLATLRDLYRRSYRFKRTVWMIHRELSKSRPKISRLYGQLAGGKFTDLILAEYDKAVAHVLAITGQESLMEHEPVIKNLIRMRNPFTDAINLMQLETLRRWHDTPEAERTDDLRQGAFLSLVAMSAAMQNMG